MIIEKGLCEYRIAWETNYGVRKARKKGGKGVFFYQKYLINTKYSNLIELFPLYYMAQEVDFLHRFFKHINIGAQKVVLNALYWKKDIQEMLCLREGENPSRC